MAWLLLIAACAMEPGGPLMEPPQEASSERVVVQDLNGAVQVDDVEVFARRGAALVAPEIELDEADIDALRAWSIEEVLQRMRETLRLGEQPVILINGQPTPNISAYTGFPPGALARAEVLPPEASGVYGAASGQRVINLVLQTRFSSYDARLVGARPTQGGTSSTSGDLRRSSIAGPATHQLGLRLSRNTALRAGERHGYLTGDLAGETGVTVRPQSDTASFNIGMTRTFGGWAGVLTMSAQRQDSRATVRYEGGVIETDRSSDTLTASAGLSGQVSGWFIQANLSGNAAVNQESGLQDLNNVVKSVTLSGGVRRSVLELPAGALTANLNANLTTSRSVVNRNGDSFRAEFSSQDLQSSLFIPLLRKGELTLPSRVIGDLSATFGAGVRQSDGAGGDELRLGLSWSPHRHLRLNGEWASSNESVAGALKTEPEYYGSPTVVFDFRAGEAVEILPLRGGNPELRPPQSDRFTLTSSLGPFTSWAFLGNLTYARAESSDGIGVLPGLTEDIEAVFPERFHRDSNARLISIDYRPLNLSSTMSESVSTSLNFNFPRPAGGSGLKSTVLRASLSHSLQLSNVVRLRAGLAGLDRLQGDGGGLSRQNAQLMIDARRGRWGMNASVQWQDEYRTRQFSGRDGENDLLIAPFMTIDVRFSLQLASGGARRDASGVAQRRSDGRLQINFDIENLFDARRSAYLGDGTPAPGYGRDVQDPLGRTVRFTLQRRF